MFMLVKHGIHYFGMGACDRMMSDEQIWKVAAFLEHIGPLPAEVEAKWKAAQ